MKHDVSFKGSKIAKWKDVEKFHLWNKTRKFRIAPKLTEAHITPLPKHFSKNESKISQIISGTVAAGLYATFTTNSTCSTTINTAILLN